MLAKVYQGPLIYVNRGQGQIQIEDLVDGTSISLHINGKTRHWGWGKLIGKVVGAIVINGKVTQVSEIED
jgi:hypothetical protein